MNLQYQKKTNVLPDDLLKKNHLVDMSAVAQYEKFARQLEALGVETKARYRLAPPYRLWPLGIEKQPPDESYRDINPHHTSTSPYRLFPPDIRKK